MSRRWKKQIKLPINGTIKMDRFWSKVDKKGPNDCWEWMAAKYPTGYGYIKRSNSRDNVYAHRFVLELEGIDIPSGMFVCHHCDNKSCVNPSHLFIGTQQDNVDDMWRKGRGLVGENHPQSKLTDSDVIAIRASELSHQETANIFGVSRRLIGMVKQRYIWKHVQ